MEEKNRNREGKELENPSPNPAGPFLIFLSPAPAHLLTPAAQPATTPSLSRSQATSSRTARASLPLTTGPHTSVVPYPLSRASTASRARPLPSFIAGPRASATPFPHAVRSPVTARSLTARSHCQILRLPRRDLLPPALFSARASAARQSRLARRDPQLPLL